MPLSVPSAPSPSNLQHVTISSCPKHLASTFSQPRLECALYFLPPRPVPSLFSFVSQSPFVSQSVGFPESPSFAGRAVRGGKPTTASVVSFDPLTNKSPIIATHCVYSECALWFFISNLPRRHPWSTAVPRVNAARQVSFLPRRGGHRLCRRCTIPHSASSHRARSLNRLETHIVLASS